MVVGKIEMKSGLMKGKRGVVMGIANQKSIAYGIAKSLFEHGAELAFTYQGEPLKKRIVPIAESFNSNLVVECDVSNSDSISSAFSKIKEEWDSIDFLVHAIAFSDKHELSGRYVDTSKDNFINTMLVSCYSFTEVSNYAEKLMTKGGSLLTLTYLGSKLVVPNYNVMGVAKAALESSIKYLAADLGEKNIRVNGISAGPVRTLAAFGISDFHHILKWNEINSPLRRNTTIEEVGDGSLYLLSDLSRGTTGEIMQIDCGYNIIGLKKYTKEDVDTLYSIVNS